jgi:hypothetical protein
VLKLSIVLKRSCGAKGDFHCPHSLATKAPQAPRKTSEFFKEKSAVRFNFLKSFLEKELTESKRFAWIELFPPKGKAIFEKYIVRLIGTPNQNLLNNGSFASAN